MTRGAGDNFERVGLEISGHDVRQNLVPRWIPGGVGPASHWDPVSTAEGAWATGVISRLRSAGASGGPPASIPAGGVPSRSHWEVTSVPAVAARGAVCVEALRPRTVPRCAGTSHCDPADLLAGAPSPPAPAKVALITVCVAAAAVLGPGPGGCGLRSSHCEPSSQCSTATALPGGGPGSRVACTAELVTRGRGRLAGGSHWEPASVCGARSICDAASSVRTARVWLALWPVAVETWIPASEKDLDCLSASLASSSNSFCSRSPM